MHWYNVQVCFQLLKTYGIRNLRWRPHPTELYMLCYEFKSIDRQQCFNNFEYLLGFPLEPIRMRRLKLNTVFWISSMLLLIEGHHHNYSQFNTSLLWLSGISCASMCVSCISIGLYRMLLIQIRNSCEASANQFMQKHMHATCRCKECLLSTKNLFYIHCVSNNMLLIKIQTFIEQ